MSNYDPTYHHRRSIRLRGYDYSRAGLYFITLCVQNRIHLFGQVKNGVMHLNVFGEIAKAEWENTPAIRKNISLGAFIVMPNHFHAILSIDYKIGDNNSIGEFKSPSQTIGAIIRGYKGATTKKIKEIIRTGELRFAPPRTGELRFAPPRFAPPRTGELPFASSIRLSGKNRSIQIHLATQLLGSHHTE